MKKRVANSLVLGAAVFAVSLVLQPFTLIQRENFGLFLLTPDWMKEVLEGPRPVSEFIGSFLVQFYNIPAVGALITALLAVCVLLCTAAVLRRLRLRFCDAAGVLAACCAWYFTAELDNIIPMVQFALYSACAAGLSRLVPKPSPKAPLRAELPVCLGVIVLASVLVGTDGTVRKNERIAKAEVCARLYDWKGVLEAATPEYAAADHRLMPFAFLALGELDRLGDEIFNYPVGGPEDFDMEGDTSETGLLFSSLLFDSLGVPNEAIHHIFQFSCHRPHGMCHLTLYQLIRYNAKAGNYTMVRKYAEVLRCSPANRATADAVLRKYADAEDTAVADSMTRAEARVVSNNPQYNLAQLQVLGISSPNAVNRFLCYLLLSGDRESFRNAFEALGWEGRIPKYYLEALRDR